jgi:hypothetical protein
MKALICQFQNFILSLLISENTILHLSFSKNRHMEAIKWLKGFGYKTVSTDHRENENQICSRLQKYLSRKIESLQIKSHSPFLASDTDFQKKSGA